MIREIKEQNKKTEKNNFEKLDITRENLKKVKNLSIVMQEMWSESNTDIKDTSSSLLDQNISNLKNSFNNITNLLKSNIGSNIIFLFFAILIFIIFLYFVSFI